ncbi:MAG: CoA-binding protein [Chloroflexota bacterium]|nr:CoA-binding protein [Chloroflexota bacterium]
MSFAGLDSAFKPDSIAVVGVSNNPFSGGYPFMRHLVHYKYKGQLYPINPGHSEAFGLPCYPSLKEVPGTVDYVICCIPAAKVLDLLDDCPSKQVKAVHMFTGRLTETGLEDNAALERDILQRAKALGVRLIGPNCMGLYNPSQGISFGYEFPADAGPIGMFFQSGGAATEFVHYASLKGLRFSKIVSYGNAIDINETELLEYFCEDPETQVIGCYIEGVKDGPGFVSALRRTAKVKPVVVLKAGRGKAGTRAVASHTASLAGSMQTWDAAIRQCGATRAESLEDLMDLMVGFKFLPPVMGRRVGIVGGGGGKSVLSADEWEEAGFDLVPFTNEIRQEIRNCVPEMWWEWIQNPVDVSIMPESAWMTGLPGNLLRMMAESPEFDLVAANLTVGGPFGKDEMTAFLGKEAEDTVALHARNIKPLAVVLDTGDLGRDDFDDWRWRMLSDLKTRLVSSGVAVFPSIGQAAHTISRCIDYYQRREVLT